MPTIDIRAFLVTLLLLGFSTSATANPFPPGYLTATLPNGLRVSILPDAQAVTVATVYYVHVGDADEEPSEHGLAHLFEHLMFGATKSTPKDAYAAFLYRCGGAHNATTSLDETVYFSEVPSERHADLLKLEADRFANIVLDQATLDNEKRIVSEELRLRNQNSRTGRLYDKVKRQILGGHPYAHGAGTPESIAQLTLDQVRAFYARHYRPANAHLIIAGQVDAPAMMQAVEKLFGELPSAPFSSAADKSPKPPKEIPALHEWKYPKNLEIFQDLAPGKSAVLAYPLPPAGSADDWAVQVMLQMLVFARSQPLHDDLVKRQRIAVEAGTYAFSFRRGGGLAFWAAYLPYRRKPTAFRVLAEARDRLSTKEWLTPERLLSAKRKLLQAEYARRDSLLDRAEEIGRAQYWYGDESIAFTAVQHIDAVQLAEVAAVYDRYVASKAPFELYVKPEKVPWWITLFGWLYPLVVR